MNTSVYMMEIPLVLGKNSERTLYNIQNLYLHILHWQNLLTSETYGEYNKFLKLWGCIFLSDEEGKGGGVYSLEWIDKRRKLFAFFVCLVKKGS